MRKQKLRTAEIGQAAASLFASFPSIVGLMIEPDRKPNMQARERRDGTEWFVLID
jgi:hypothetical protein